MRSLILNQKLLAARLVVRPSPELKDAVAFIINPETEHRKLLMERLLKMLAIPTLDVKHSPQVQGGMPPLGNLMGNEDLPLYVNGFCRFPGHGGPNPIAIQPPFR